MLRPRNTLWKTGVYGDPRTDPECGAVSERSWLIGPMGCRLEGIWQAVH